PLSEFVAEELSHHPDTERLPMFGFLGFRRSGQFFAAVKGLGDERALLVLKLSLEQTQRCIAQPDWARFRHPPRWVERELAAPSEWESVIPWVEIAFE